MKEESFGYVVVNRTNEIDRFLLVRSMHGHLGFPKGHPEENEEPIETAKRELEEETGLTKITGIPGIVFTEEYTFERKGEKVQKKNTFFLGITTEETVRPQAGEII